MNSANQKDKNYNDKKREKPSMVFDKSSHKKQGKMNPKDPFARITIYESDEGEQEAIEISSSEDGVSYLNTNNVTSLDQEDENVLMTALINKAVLNGACFVTVMAKNQGKGAKNLKGNDLKRHLTWKEQKMIISKLAFKGANLKKMELFLTAVRIHLNGNANYVATASNIVASICKILKEVCFMENVDNGIMSEYFNSRVADIRNRRNYEAK